MQVSQEEPQATLLERDIKVTAKFYENQISFRYIHQNEKKGQLLFSKRSYLKILNLPAGDREGVFVGEALGIYFKYFKNNRLS